MKKAWISSFHYDKIEAGKLTPFIMNIAICSSICGNYDNIKDTVKQTVPCEFILFTDNPNTGQLASKKGWSTIVRRYSYSNPRMESKYPKLIPHVLLPDFDYVVWADAQVQICSEDYLKMMLTTLGSREYAFVRHWIRDCIYDEICAMYKEQPIKYKGSLSRDQVTSYKKEGMPEHFGLWAGTSWVRNNKSVKACEIGNRWFNEDIKWNTKDYSSNDQLALAYIIWKFNFKEYIGTIPYDYWTSRMKLHEHNTKK